MESGLQPVLERNQDGVHVHLGSVVGSVEDGWFAFASWTGDKTIEVTILSKLGEVIGRPGHAAFNPYVSIVLGVF